MGFAARGLGRKTHAKGAKDAKEERSLALLPRGEIVLKPLGFLRMNCRAKRLDCAELAPVVEPPTPYDNARPPSVSELRRVAPPYASRSSVAALPR